MKKILFAISLIFLTNTAQAFTCSEGGFSIWMPSEPTLQEVNHKSFVGNVKENSYTLKTETEKYSSSYTKLPGAAFDFLSDNSLLNKAKKSFLKATGAQEVSSQNIVLQGKVGMELVFQIPSENNSNPTSGKARFYLYEKKLYVVTMTANQGPEGNALIDRYLNSFKLFSTLGKEFSLNSFQKE